MKGYSFSIDKYLARFALVNNTCEKHDRMERKERNRWSHYVILHRLLNFMSSRGWTIEHDKDVPKIIRKDFWYGRKGNLEFHAHRYPKGFETQFFQNVVFENRHGGKYDFDKFNKMPYLIKLMFINETQHMKAFLKSIVPGILDNTIPEYKFATDRIKANYAKSWHHPQKSMDEFDLSDLDGQTSEHSFNNTDRDKKTIYNGQIKYFRDWDGRLMRGKVYHNINNMWWVILNSHKHTNVADFELFDPTPDDYLVRRDKDGKPPEKYLLMCEQISVAKTKELMNELKRRGVKIA